LATGGLVNVIDSVAADSFVGVYSESDALIDRWRTASSQAAAAYAHWRRVRDAASYVAYRASADRADAAQDELAAALAP
jgi:hypothetical protein